MKVALFVFINSFSALSESHAIMGGSTTQRTKPYEVVITTGESLCTGTMITSRFVLTAAHCVRDSFMQILPPESISLSNARVYAGTRLPKRQRDGVKIAQIYYHEDYDYSRLKNDIALIKLVDPLDSAAYQTVYIATPEDEENYGLTNPGTMGLASGWGITNPSSENPAEILQEVELPILDMSICKNPKTGIPVIPSSKVDSKLDPSFQLCAGSIRNSLDPIGIGHGDSGGPLVVRTVNGLLFQIGISSFGRDGRPGVFTRVSAYSSWIRKTLDYDASFHLFRWDVQALP